MSKKILEEKGVIALVENTLTDGSKAYDVAVGPVTFYMTGQVEAEDFYNQLTGLSYDSAAMTAV